MTEQIDETKRRRSAIVQAVQLFVMDHGFWPSVVELSRMTEIPETSARRHIMMLVRQEILRVAPGDRGIALGLPEVDENLWRKDGPND